MASSAILTPPHAPHLSKERRRRVVPQRDAASLASLGPNWFASVMGTGGVAIAAMLLPLGFPLREALAAGFWLLAVVLLAVVASATVVRWRRHPARARGDASDPAMAPFYGAPPMALLVVGAATLLAGSQIVGPRAALVIDGVLWSAGTLAGLACSVTIPYLMITRMRQRRDQALATWLMPIVPPMVSAATGAALVPHLAAGQEQLSLLLACYGMFGLSLIASLLMIALVWARLMFDGPGPAATVPTLWIALGVLGQSITAVSLLGNVAPQVIGPRYGSALQALPLIYGVPVLGFAILWLALAVAITLRTAREGLPFTLSWWSFTFPVATVVTGTSELARLTGLIPFQLAAVALFALLLLGWGAAARGTALGTASGRLLVDPPRGAILIRHRR